MENEMAIVKYDVNEAEISKMANIYMELTVKDVDDQEGFDSVHAARMVMVKHRTSVERLRKSANENAQKFIKNNNANASKLIELMEPIETHLRTEEDKVAKEKERIRVEQEAKERACVEIKINDLLRYGVIKPFVDIANMSDGEYQTLFAFAKTTYEAEQKRIADEKARMETERLALQKEREEESTRLEKQRQEQFAENLRLQNIRKDQEAAALKIEAEKKAIEDAKREAIRAHEEAERKEQERKGRELFEKQAAENARIKAEKEAVEKVAREAREKKEREEAEIAEKARIEELKPDKVKLVAYAQDLFAHIRESAFVPKNKAVKKILAEAERDLESIALNILNKAEGLK